MIIIQKFTGYTLLCLMWTLSVNAVTIQQRVNNKNYSIPKIKHNMSIDGNIDEAAWQKALVFELTVETNPGENIEAPVKTTAYLFEDGENIYVAFKAYDNDPSKIRAHYHDHDYIFDDDSVGLKVDTYNDALHAYQFFVNALGVKHDSIEDDTTQSDDLSWNAIWDAASQITKDGYQVEFSIPLRILRFDDSKSEQVWGFDLLRFYPRELFHRISYHKLDRDISCGLCQNSTISGFTDIKKGKNLSIVPFMTATQNQTRENPSDNWDDTGLDTDFGVDLRWGISADTTLNATINPDFSQVESDVAQLDNNNTFSIFYSEKRPFFVEGADYYKSLINVVHTRNITDPDYGMKVTHSSGGNNFATFFSNDTLTNYLLPGSLESNFASLNTDSINGVFRYRRDLENTSSVGAIVTVREADNYHNYVYGIDGSFRLSDTDVIRAQILQSDSEDPDDIVTEFARANNDTKGSAVELHYRHKSRDWILWGRYKRFSPEFRADLGFQPRADFNRYVTGFRRYWYASNDHWWNSISAGLDIRNSYDLNGQVIENWINSTVQYKGPMQSEVELRIMNGERAWNGRIYDHNETAINSELTLAPGIIFHLFASSDETIDYSNSQSGDLLSISPRLTVNLGQHFQTELRYTSQKMDVNGGELFDSKLLDARLIYQFSVQSFLRLVIQYNDSDYNPDLYSYAIESNYKNLGTQLLYSYKINPQTVFFLGYSDAAYEDDTYNQLQKTDKTLFLKMSYSWLR